MFKYVLLLAINLLLIGSAIGNIKKADTTLMLFRNESGSVSTAVSTLDSADFFMLVISPDSIGGRYIIKQFYKGGMPMFIGSADPKETNPRNGHVMLDGDFISYYPNGKRSAMGKYNMGYIEGLEYHFYPSGAIYCTTKHSYAVGYGDHETNWECYDTNGNMICKAGNGHWIMYDDSCKQVLQEGTVVKGNMDGEWYGKIIFPDTIKYKFNYKKGVLLSSFSYDRFGKQYNFVSQRENAAYKNGPIDFVERLRNHIKIIKDGGGDTTQIDNLKIAFIVEKDGTISHSEVIGEVSPDLKENILSALQQCADWEPHRVYGIPYRVRIIFPLKKVLSYYSGLVFNQEVKWEEKLLASDDADK